MWNEEKLNASWKLFFFSFKLNTSIGQFEFRSPYHFWCQKNYVFYEVNRIALLSKYIVFKTIWNQFDGNDFFFCFPTVAIDAEQSHKQSVSNYKLTVKNALNTHKLLVVLLLVKCCDHELLNENHPSKQTVWQLQMNTKQKTMRHSPYRNRTRKWNDSTCDNINETL